MDNNGIYESVGRNVREYRLQKRLSQQELAERIGYKGKDMISRIESGQTRVPMPKLMEMAKVLGVEVTDLIKTEQQPDRTLPPGAFHGGQTTRPDLIPIFEELKTYSGEDIARIKAYMDVLRSMKKWQMLNGTANGGDYGSQLTDSSAPSPLLFLDEEDARKWKEEHRNAVDSQNLQILPPLGNDTSES